jgi:hypothetical protein
VYSAASSGRTQFWVEKRPGLRWLREEQALPVEVAATGRRTDVEAIGFDLRGGCQISFSASEYDCHRRGRVADGCTLSRTLDKKVLK